MKTLSILVLLTAGLQAHPWQGGAADKEAMRQHVLEEWMQQHAVSQHGEIKPLQVASAATVVHLAAVAAANAAGAPTAAQPFLAYPRLELKWDKDFLFVGSNGMPDHSMMVGIKSWQQQVPLPQAYYGSNAWRIPLHPTGCTGPNWMPTAMASSRCRRSSRT